MKSKMGWLCLMPLLMAGCTKPTSLPEQPSQDPSARTTTAFNPPSTPQEMAVRCDVPLYAGARSPDGLSRFKPEADGSMHYELVLTTSDAPKKVADFYSAALKLPAVKSKGAITIVGKTPRKRDVIIEVVSEGGQTVVRIHSIQYKNA